MDTDPEAQGWSVSMDFKAPVERAGDGGQLPQGAGAPARVADAEPAPARDCSPAERAVPRRPGRRQHPRAHRRDVREWRPRCRRARSPRACPRSCSRRAACSSSASAPRNSTGRAARCWPPTSAPSTSGPPLRARATPASTCATSSSEEPIPGIEFEYKVASTYLPSVTADEVNALAKTLITDDNRVVLGVAPEKKATPPPTVDTLKSALARAGSAPVERWTDATSGRDLVEKPPAARHGGRPPDGGGRWRHGPHALERRRGVAQAHGLQERSGGLHVLRARRPVAGPSRGLQEREPRHRDGGHRRPWRPEPGGSQQDALGEDRPGVAVDRRLHRGDGRVEHAARSRDRAQVELSGVHRAELHARDARPREAPPHRQPGEPRAEPARGVRREGGRGQHLATTTVRRRSRWPTSPP